VIKNRTSGKLVVAVLLGCLCLSLSAEELAPIEVLQSSYKTYPNLSPDSRFLIYSEGEEGKLNIYRMNMSNSTIRALSNNDSEDSAAVWSPDGKWIVFQREDSSGQRDIWLMESDGSSLQNMTESQFDEQHPRFSHDQQYIIFDSNRDHIGALGDDAQQNFEIYRMNIAKKSVERLTNWPNWDMYGSLSSDGKRLVWRRIVENEKNNSRNFEIFVKDLKTGVETNISSHDAIDTNPHWSPNGEVIVFASDRNSVTRGFTDLFTVTPDGQNLTQITNGGGIALGYTRPSFTYDGKTVLANRFAREMSDIVSISIFSTVRN